MPIRLTLIAHAETDATRRGLFPTDEGLDLRGRKAARAAAASAGMAPKGATALSSPAPAAVETAMVLNLKATVVPVLNGLDVGTWAGQSVMNIGMSDPEAATAWIDDPTFAGHGGESIEALIARVGAWLVERRGIEGISIAITHAAVLRAAAIAALNAPAAAFWRIDAAPLAALTLSSDGHRWTLRELRQL